MPRSMLSRRPLWLCSILLLATATAFAQFTASIQGVVQDPTGAGRRQSHHPFGERRNREHDSCEQR